MRGIEKTLGLVPIVELCMNASLDRPVNQNISAQKVGVRDMLENEWIIRVWAPSTPLKIGRRGKRRHKSGNMSAKLGVQVIAQADGETGSVRMESGGEQKVIRKVLSDTSPRPLDTEKNVYDWGGILAEDHRGTPRIKGFECCISFNNPVRTAAKTRP
jgi:hypothetical protein